MRKQLLFVLAALLSAVAVAQPSIDARPNWPQPIIKGSILIWGGEEAKEEAVSRFVRLAGKEQILIVSSTADTARADWASAENAKVVSTLDVSDLDSFSFVWLDSYTLGTEESQARLLKIKQSGGAVAMSEKLFASGKFQALFPYVNVQDGALDMDVSDDGVITLRGRYLFGFGEGQTTFHFAATVGYEETEVVIKNRGRQDLISLQRRAIDRTLPPFPVEKKPIVPKGSLMIVGGGGLPEPMVERFIELAGGPDALIVYVPCSFEEEIAQEPGFVRLLRSKGAKNVTWIHTKDRVKSDTDEEFLAPLKKAGGVWFGGGRQWNLVDSYMDTQAHELMRDVLKRGGAIGGSSAGASIQAEFLARGDPLGNLNILAPGYLRGLGFLPGAAVDQHFTQRGRQKDMTQLMKAYPQVLGIGIDEATAIVVQGSVAEVMGNGAVHFYDYRTPPKGDIDYLKLKAGKKYELVKRKEIG